MVTLVIGLSGCGKSTYARHMIGDHGLCYDLDAIAAAFRLRTPHEEYSPQARKMANDLFYGFIRNARDYSDMIVIIRTAPEIPDVEAMRPDNIVWMKTRHEFRVHGNENNAMRRIYDIKAYAEENGIPFEVR